MMQRFPTRQTLVSFVLISLAALVAFGAGALEFPKQSETWLPLDLPPVVNVVVPWLLVALSIGALMFFVSMQEVVRYCVEESERLLDRLGN